MDKEEEAEEGKHEAIPPFQPGGTGSDREGGTRVGKRNASQSDQACNTPGDVSEIPVDGGAGNRQRGGDQQGAGKRGFQRKLEDSGVERCEEQAAGVGEQSGDEPDEDGDDCRGESTVKWAVINAGSKAEKEGNSESEDEDCGKNEQRFFAGFLRQKCTNNGGGYPDEHAPTDNLPIDKLFAHVCDGGDERGGKSCRQRRSDGDVAGQANPLQEWGGDGTPAFTEESAKKTDENTNAEGGAVPWNEHYRLADPYTLHYSRNALSMREGRRMMRLLIVIR